MQFQLLCFLLLTPLASCIHFYMKPGEVKCFYENLAKNNLLVGDFDAFVERDHGIYEEDPSLKLTITVDETFDNDHRVLNQKNSHTGDFTFTALETGEHRVCIKPTYSRNDAKLRIVMDMEIGHVHSLDTKRTSQVKSLKERIHQLTDRLESVRAEQKVIKEKEAVFRNQSEAANSKIVFWSAVQLIALIATCVLQLRYLKNFFVKQKVV